MAATNWTLPLADPTAELTTVGGKGASLARLAGSALPVPDGFHVVTDAYRAFVDSETVATALKADLDAEAVAELFASADLPAGLAEELTEHCGKLSAPFAVRSSATAEDLPDLSFAGQMDSFLNVTEPADVIAAVRSCWASLWTDRAVEYRRRNDIDSTGLAIAVVVQELVPARISGVLFTADPVSHRTDHLMVNSTWGLGESLVDGTVTGDQYIIDKASHTVITRDLGDKTVEAVPTETGTRQRPITGDRRSGSTLTDDQLALLAELGTRIEDLYGRPMDIEWAWTDEPHILQARPITGLAEDREVWNDSLIGDFLWTSVNLGEAMPNVMTPAAWALIRENLTVAMVLPEPKPVPLAGNIGGRLYLNYSAMIGTATALGFGRLMSSASEIVFGGLPADLTVPPLPMPRGRIIRQTLSAGVRAMRQLRHYQGNLDRLVAEYPQRCERARQAIHSADGPERLQQIWTEHCAPLFHDAPRMLAAGSRVNATILTRLRPWLRRLVDEADVSALTSGAGAGGQEMASLGPLRGLQQLADGQIDRDTYAARWGHRCPDELEVSTPRPAEDPEWIDRQLANLAGAPDVDELLELQSRRRAEAMDRFRAAHPRQVAKLRRWLSKNAESVRAREATRSESVRCIWVMREWMIKVGEVTGLSDDVFFLSPPEMLRVLAGDSTVASVIPARKAAHRHYQALPVYPTLIRGRFDPEAWAADPHRRTDRFEKATGRLPTRTAGDDSATVSGTPGSAGVVEGIARVIIDPDDAGMLEVGEILVTKVTNVGWTPIFPRAAAVVTDIGATLSHAAIVARELGIPAVVGTGVATERLRSGDRVRVDGSTGTVEVLSLRDCRVNTRWLWRRGATITSIMETIVFVHGLGSGPRAWHPQRIALQGRYRVVTPTLPGHGDKPGPFTLRSAVEAVTDELCRGAHLVGMAAGGTIALLAAMTHSPLLGSLTLSSPITHQTTTGALHRAVAAVATPSMLRSILWLPESPNPATRAVIAEDLAACGRTTIREALTKLSHIDLRPRLDQVTVPTLVLAGQRDRVGIDAATETAYRLSEARLHLVPDAGRMWNLELPNTFNRILTGFIDVHTHRTVGG
ncbi:pyruvate,water dikinase [Stackebrandtia endophytica]|uniref:Pyruvate,water dikinase n=1 Tax=Stackebrandtia endophytica TaxID=1496996 RepID=A0A543APY4_9ACTN|nr:alpha/beta fold hydrolase [Stackebrandtia endophytica]TQL74653.1 pyruvate,water dikinase [Stackebrandtia endophytica]